MTPLTIFTTVSKHGVTPPDSVLSKALFNCTQDFAFGVITQRLVHDYFPEGTVITTWNDVLLLLGEYQIDEGFARSMLLFNLPNTFSAINILPIHGKLNSSKSDFVTED